MTQPGSDYIGEIKRLTRTRGDTEARLDAARQAIALADTHGDVANGIFTRLQLVQIAEFSGRWEEALINFTWCIGRCNDRPDLFQRFRHATLWRFKWILSSIPKFPTVSRQQINEMFTEMTAYYDKAGAGNRPIHSLKARAAVCLGDLDAVARHMDAWKSSPKDGLQDCPACEDCCSVEIHLAANQFGEAIACAAELIAGNSHCAEQPAIADAQLLVPLFTLKKLDVAQHLEIRSFEKIRANRAHFAEMGCYLAYLAATDQHARGITMLESLLRELPHVQRGYDRMAGLKGAHIFVRRLKAVGVQTARLRAPEELPFHRPDGQYPVESLIAWFHQEAAKVAAEFDRRNGNATVSASLASFDYLLDTIHPIASDVP